MKTLVLDAMGVMYSEGDDGHKLLLPFIREKGGLTDYAQIVPLFLAVELGRMTSADFWKSVNLDPALEDEYLLRHRLTDGLFEFLDVVTSRGIAIWCLSNSISEWSKKLCHRFGLSHYFNGFVISGDVGSRKPEPAIYQHLIQKAGIKPSEAVFVDDRSRNLAPAAEMGFDTVLFNPDARDLSPQHFKVVRTFPELLNIL